MNTNGQLGNPGLANRGGLIQDHNGAWIKGFARSIRVSNSVDAGLWALREWLIMCRNLNLGEVEIEIDAKIVFGWIIEEYSSRLHHASLILDCRTLIS